MRRFLLPLFFVAPALLAQGTLEVISLRHRTADQVIPVLRPLLEPGGTLSGQYNQLIVRTSPRNLAEIRAVLDSIDQLARRLTISVRFDNAQQTARSGLSQDSRSSLDERVDQRIQVLEGGRALISGGESRPLRQRQVIQTPGGPVVRETTVIQGASTGFEVVPRLSGTTVYLDIAPQREQFGPGGSGAIRSERVATTVSGRLGEWIDLGGVNSASARADSGIPSSRERTAGGSSGIWVKVEETR